MESTKSELMSQDSFKTKLYSVKTELLEIKNPLNYENLDVDERRKNNQIDSLIKELSECFKEEDVESLVLKNLQTLFKDDEINNCKDGEEINFLKIKGLADRRGISKFGKFQIDILRTAYQKLWSPNSFQSENLTSKLQPFDSLEQQKNETNQHAEQSDVSSSIKENIFKTPELIVSLQKEYPKSETDIQNLIDLYNSVLQNNNDSYVFTKCYEIIRIGDTDVMLRARRTDSIPLVLKELDAGDFLAIKMKTENNFLVVPKFRVIISDTIFNLVDNAFDIDNFDPKMRYKSIKLLKPALCIFKDGEYKIKERGELQLGSPESNYG